MWINVHIKSNMVAGHPFDQGIFYRERGIREYSIKVLAFSFDSVGSVSKVMEEVYDLSNYKISFI